MKTFSLYLCLLPFFFSCCNTTEPSLSEDISISVHDVGVTEAYIHVSFANKEPRSLNLFRNNRKVFSFDCSDGDTIINDTALIENTQYKYKVVMMSGSNILYESNEIIASTLIASSHEIVWEKFLFGDTGTSEINDIAYIDDNNIWAVGSIWQKDSLKPFYNALHWDGKEWRLKKILSKVSHDNNSLVAGALKSIFASSPSDIWATDGGQIIHWNGSVWAHQSFLFESLTDTSFHGINYLNGINEKVVWAIGNRGNLFSSIKNGTWSSWQKEDFGFSGNYNDMWSFEYNNSGGQGYLVNSDYPYNFIIHIDYYLNNYTSSKFENKYISSVWTRSGHPIYLAGDGVFYNKNNNWEPINNISNKFVEKIRGDLLNDIFIVGHYGLIAHFNGLNWRTYPTLEMDGIYKTVALGQELVVIGGKENSNAVLLIGKRKK